MRKLNQQKPAFRDGNVSIANLLAAGPIGITYAHLVERLRTRGAPVEWIALKPMVAAPIFHCLGRATYESQCGESIC